LTGLAALGGSPTQVAGPGFGRLDLSLFKDFRFAERFRLQFRWEFFNIFNHPNFNPPDFPAGATGLPPQARLTSRVRILARLIRLVILQTIRDRFSSP
jgi:hypothetical protein